MGILYISHMNHIGMLIGITHLKTLTCGSCSHVEGTLMWLPYNSCVTTIQELLCTTCELYARHMGVVW